MEMKYVTFIFLLLTRALFGIYGDSSGHLIDHEEENFTNRSEKAFAKTKATKISKGEVLLPSVLMTTPRSHPFGVSYIFI